MVWPFTDMKMVIRASRAERTGGVLGGDVQTVSALQGGVIEMTVHLL